MEHLEQAASEGDVHALYAVDLAFHTALVELTGNGRLLELFNRSVPALRAIISLDERAYGSLADVAQAHWALVKAIEEGDENVASRYAEQHVDDASTHVIDQLRVERTEAEG